MMAYQVNPQRWMATTEAGREAAEVELSSLAAERGRGETLAIHGDIWGTAADVVYSPRSADDRFETVAYDPLRYPTVASVCEFRSPNDDPDDGEA